MTKSAILERRINPRTSWTDCDGPVYISFSRDTWRHYNYRDLGKYFDADMVSYIQSSRELSPTHIQQVKQKLESEWGTKAGVNIKYHDPSEKDYSGKNMLFIFVNDIFSKFPDTLGQTISISPLDSSTFFKIILFEEQLANRNSGFFWQTVLHEGGHAFVSLRDVSDLEFQEGIDCSLTVMATTDTCFKLEQEKIRLEAAPTPIEVDWLERFDEIMPTNLTELDIESAHYYKETCLKKRKTLPVTPSFEEITKQNPTIPSSTSQYDRNTRTPTPLIAKFSLYVSHFGSSFTQSFFHTFVDYYIQPLLLSADYNKSFIDIFCNGLKTSLNFTLHGAGYTIFSQFLQYTLSKTMKKMGCNDHQITKMKNYLLPALSIVASFQEGVILEKFLLQNATTALGHKAGYEFAWLLIRNMPKIKSEETLPFPITRSARIS